MIMRMGLVPPALNCCKHAPCVAALAMTQLFANGVRYISENAPICLNNAVLLVSLLLASQTPKVITCCRQKQRFLLATEHPLLAAWFWPRSRMDLLLLIRRTNLTAEIQFHLCSMRHAVLFAPRRGPRRLWHTVSVGPIPQLLSHVVSC